ncbi:MAG: hypothetical protein K2J82_06210 [Muribaculaceae bacterium]|nr:hypothetical protein [Muribaculaceae bacterium]MDE6754186.1 hypothetical protein [Muribaculaceae bacterium]
MKLIIPLAAFIFFLSISCRGTATDSQAAEKVKNGVYYWKTVFNLDSTDLAFMQQHNIGRIYLRMFDVVENRSYPDKPEKTIPNATVRISDPQYQLLQDSLSDVEFIPTVYITLEAMKAVKDEEGVLASNIVKRIRNMCQYNKLPNVGELQLDCDWTQSTEQSFFRLCDSVRYFIAQENLPWQLSSTIRLHQLSGKNPPVDKGVLMVYNTGDYFDQDTRNSIIDPAEVEPYISRLSDYTIPLDVAYPTYSWQLLFSDREFAGLTQGINLADTSMFSRNNNLYAVKETFTHNDRYIYRGDIIKAEDSDIKDILATKKMIEQHLKSHTHSNILYHLDFKNLSKYSSDEIDAILAN